MFLSVGSISLKTNDISFTQVCGAKSLKRYDLALGCVKIQNEKEEKLLGCNVDLLEGVNAAILLFSPVLK